MVLGKIAFFFLPPVTKTGEGEGGAGGAWPEARGPRRRPGVGEKREGVQGSRFPHLLRAEAVYGGSTTAAGRGGRGGGVARRGRGLAAAGELEEVEGGLPLPSPRAERQRGALATRAGGRRAG